MVTPQELNYKSLKKSFQEPRKNPGVDAVPSPTQTRNYHLQIQPVSLNYME